MCIPQYNTEYLDYSRRLVHRLHLQSYRLYYRYSVHHYTLQCNIGFLGCSRHLDHRLLHPLYSQEPHYTCLLDLEYMTWSNTAHLIHHMMYHLAYKSKV